MTSTSDTDTTNDAFLGGRLILRQPRRGYRAGVDPILLAASVPTKAGQSVLDLGCGVGAALFALATRVPQLTLLGIEVQPDYADLARVNAAANGLTAHVWTADLMHMPIDLRQIRVDHVITNPPYYRAGTGTAPDAKDRSVAHREATPLADWITVGARRLKPGGTFSVIQRADRLPDLLSAMSGRLGGLVTRPILPRQGRDASLVIVQGTKGGRSAARLAAPIVMHDDRPDSGFTDDYTAPIRQVLRDAAPLPGNR